MPTDSSLTFLENRLPIHELSEKTVAARGFFTEFNSGSNTGRTGEFGYYWSSSMLSSSDGTPDNAWAYISHTTDGTVSKGDFLRCFGLSVRPVCTE